MVMQINDQAKQFDDDMITDIGIQLIWERGGELIREIEQISGKGTFINRWLWRLESELKGVADAINFSDLETENTDGEQA